MSEEPLAFPHETRAAFWLLALAAASLGSREGSLLVAMLRGSSPGNPFDAELRLAGLVLFLAVVVSVQLLLRHRMKKRYGSVPQTERERIDAATLAKSAAQMGVPLAGVSFVGNLGDSRALTIGNRRRPVIILGRGLRFLKLRQSDQFSAIFLHELGHIVNRDVGMTQMARVLIWAYMLVALPGAAYRSSFLIANWLTTQPQYSAAGPGVSATFLYNLSLLGASVFVPLALPVAIYFLYRMFLRDREFAADRVGSLLGGKSGLSSVFLLRIPAQEVWWRRLLAVHPTTSSRNDNLFSAVSFTRVSYSTTLFLGVLFALFEMASSSATSLVPGAEDVAALGIASILQFLCALTAINHVERSAYFSKLDKRTPFSTLTPRVAAGALFFFVGYFIVRLLDSLLSAPYSQQGFEIRDYLAEGVFFGLFIFLCAAIIPSLLHIAPSRRRPVLSIACARFIILNVLTMVFLIYLSLTELTEVRSDLTNSDSAAMHLFIRNFGDEMAGLAQNDSNAVSVLVVSIALNLAFLFLIFALRWSAWKVRRWLVGTEEGNWTNHYANLPALSAELRRTS